MSEPAIKARTVNCPTCKQPSLFSPENAYRPFCSKRCKMIDLGEWASENFRIPEAIKPEDLPENEV